MRKLLCLFTVHFLLVQSSTAQVAQIDPDPSTVDEEQLAPLGIKQLPENIRSKSALLSKELRSYFFLNYSGIAPNFKNLPNQSNQSANGIYVGYGLHKSFFSFEARTGYMSTVVYDYPVMAGSPLSGYYYVDNAIMRLQRKGVSLGFAAGLNLPIHNFNLFTTYGTDVILFTVKNKNFTPRYKLEETGPTYPFFNMRLTFGSTFRIPNSPFGITGQFSLNHVKSKQGHIVPISDSERNGREFSIRQTTHKNYKFSSAGLSICWFFRDKK